MNRVKHDSLVTGYENLIGGLVLPASDDRHVLAAAMHPDEFIALLFESQLNPARS